MNKIIKIQLADDNLLRVTLLLTTSCTYACRYCPETLRTGKHLPIDLDKLKEFFKKFSHRKIIVLITGGEASTHPQFKETLEMLKELNLPVQVDSNAVRTSRFFNEVCHLVDIWSFTLHPSQHKLDLEKIKPLTDRSFVLVNVAMDPDHWDKSVEWYKLAGQLNNVKSIPIRLGHRGGEELTPYTKEQDQWFLDNQYAFNFTEERKNQILKENPWIIEAGSFATYDDGSVKIVDPYMLVKEKQNIFTGWTCYAGNDSVTIYPNGQAGWANCRIKTYDHFLDLTPEEMKNPLTCTMATCDCGTDIRSTKIRNE